MNAIPLPSGPARRTFSTLALALFSFFALIGLGRAQNINGSLTGITTPTGTSGSPAFVIDSDAANAAAGYTRDSFPVSASAFFARNSTNPSDSIDYRIAVQLVDDNDNYVNLSSGSSTVTTVYSAVQTITVTSSIPFAASSFSVSIDPAVDLGAGRNYRARVTLQRLGTIDLGSGIFLPWWYTADGPDLSLPFTIVHFTDSGVPAANKNVRAYTTGLPAFSQGYAVNTDSAKNRFRVSVPYYAARYDLGGANESITFRLTATLTDDLGNPVSLNGGGTTTRLVFLNRYNSTSPLSPAASSGSLVAEFSPATQLDSRNRTYRVRVALEHIEVPSSTYLGDGTTGDSSLQRLLHFNGNLAFGPIATLITSLGNNPTPGTLGAGFVNTAITVSNGSISSDTALRFGTGASLNVQLLSNGNAVVTSGTESVFRHDGNPVSATFNHVRVSYSGVTLNAAGAQATAVTVHLPQGLGYTPVRASSSGRYQSTFAVAATVSLNPSFRHSVNLAATTAGSDSWTFDESRTLLYRVRDFEFRTTGEIIFNSDGVEWVHSAATTQLQSQQSAGQHQTSGMAYRLTNEGHLHFARISSTRPVAFVAASDSTARTESADFEFDPGRFRTHFPQNVPVEWESPGYASIVHGLFKNDSELPDPKDLLITYDAACPGNTCGPAGGAPRSIVATPSPGRLRITPDGGLYADTTFDAHRFEWGIRSTGAFTHCTGKFGQGEFFMPGSQIYAKDNPLSSAGSHWTSSSGPLAPGVLLNASYEVSSGKLVFAETADYLAGTGAHPGLTSTVRTTSDFGASRIADMSGESEYLLLEDASKYYVRPSGLSGRQVAVDGTFDSGAILYGYSFAFTRFQLTFLSDENRDSWINGSVDVPEPSGFAQKFTGLRVSCTGALESAEIDPSDAGAKPLVYWNGSFEPLAITFNPRTGASCDAERFLTIGLTTGAANIPTSLSGKLAFKPNGHLATPADDIVGVDGRIGLPARIPLDGPGNETYSLVPATKLYFNDPGVPGAPATGYVNFAASCGVPFFEDLKVHCMTSAQAGIPASFYMTRGWQVGSDSFFTRQNFDAQHRGFPAAAPSVEDYRQPAARNAWVPQARQSIFGYVDLEYDLKWHPTGRYFTTWEASTDDLFVIEVEHQVDYLSADNAEISFGAQYDGLPQINLASAVYNAAEEQLGAAQALTNAASRFVTDTLNDGVDQIGNLVSDNLENVLDAAIDEVGDEVIDPLYDAVVQSYNDAVAANLQYHDWVNAGSGELRFVFDQYLDGSVGLAANSVKGRLQQLSDVTADATNLVSQVRHAVDRGILAIDSLTGQLQTYTNGSVEIVALTPPPGFSPDELINGLLREVSGPSGGPAERQIVQALVHQLLGELTPPDIAGVIEPLLADISSELNAELNTLLRDFDPALDRITEALLQAREFLVEIRSKLEAGEDLLNHFQDIIDNATAEIDSFVAAIRQTAYDFIDRIAAGAIYLPDTVLGSAGDLLAEFDKEEFVALLRGELRDLILGSDFVQQIQYTLRQYISELDMAMRSAIDSAFGEVNRMVRELIQELLGPIDEAINGLIGDVNRYVGAGSIDGYAHIQGDTLRRLRLDAEVQIKIPEDMTLKAYFEMNCYDADSDVGSSGCLSDGERVVEVKIGAVDVPLDWISPDVRANLEVRFSMKTAPSVSPRGIGGSLAMTSGEIDFQGLKIIRFAAGIGIGVDECYLAATAGVIVSSYEASGGIFFGRTCSVEPLRLVDPDVADVLGAPPFTGAYVYGEVWIPISEVVLGIPASCLFRVSAGVGAGAFYFAEGPTYGGKMLLGVSGEALCVVSIRGEVRMVGVMSGGSLRFTGRGTLTGKAGACPFCIKFSESARVTYQNGSWSLD